MKFVDILARVAERQDLSEAEAAGALDMIVEGDVGEVGAAAFLMGLRVKGETAEEIAGLVGAMRRHAIPVVIAEPESALDIVGTGGDRLGTFNISTAAAFVAAGAGARVAKHGNRAASSRCGSADVLEALGVRIDLGPEQVAECIDQAGMGFMLAARYHPAAGRVAPVRRALGVRTVFNFLGPLTNPARAGRQLVGVSSAQHLQVIAQAIARGQTSRALVVHGSDGMDEVAVTGPSTLIEVAEGRIERTQTIQPEDLGLARWGVDELAGGDPMANARLLREVLSGAPGAARDAVLANAGVALYVGGHVEAMADGVALARTSIDSGGALAVLEHLVAFSHTFPAAES